MIKEKIILFILICGGIWAPLALIAQDFGFGFDDDNEAASSSSGSSSAVSLKVSGELAAEVTPFIIDFMEEEEPQDISLWNAKLNLAFSSPYIDIFTNFNFNTDSVNELWAGNSRLKESNYTPLIIDEAYLRAYMGPLNIEAGMRKLTWGKADNNGPLDVTNPIDYSDLRSITDLMACKIARPMVHITFNTGDFSKLEGVFIPNFTGHRFASEGRWVPSQLSSMTSIAGEGILNRAKEKYPPMAGTFDSMFPMIAPYFDGFSPEYPSTKSFDYFQAGLRYTATAGSVDIGIQYYYGNLFRPSFTISGVDVFIDNLVQGNLLMPPYTGNPLLLSPQIKYNRYHQIGVDYAQVIAGFNIRAEAAIHLTEDPDGDDGSVRNPFAAWSFGFDRDLFWGINANIQCNETIRLLDDKVGNNPVMDAEAGTDLTSTRLTMQLSKKFFKDNLECKATAIWDVENADYHIIPAIIWTKDNIITELSAGFFAGDESGELGQYWENNFARLALKFLF